jgi:SH3-like domain-containing protein
LPVEITAEFENWRRIRDAEGTEGWVYHSLLSGRRTGMVIAKSQDELVPLYNKADVESALVARLERGVIGVVKRCSENWCYFNGRGFEGWIQQFRLWGVYPNEKVD